MTNGTISALTITEDTWRALYPHGTTEEFDKHFFPDNIIYLLNDYFASGLQPSKQHMNGYTGCRVVVLDENYLKWLEIMGMDHDFHSMSLYNQRITNDTATKLMKINGVDHADWACALCFTLWPNDISDIENKDMRLPDNLAKAFEQFIVKQCAPGKVKAYVPGCIMDGSTWQNKAATIQSAASVFFDENKRLQVGCMDMKDTFRDAEGLYFMYIPFVVREYFTDALFSIKDICNPYTFPCGDPIELPVFQLSASEVMGSGEYKDYMDIRNQVADYFRDFTVGFPNLALHPEMVYSWESFVLRPAGLRRIICRISEMFLRNKQHAAE